MHWEVRMRRLLLLILLSSGFLVLAQQPSDNNSAVPETSTDSKGQVTVQGCLDRSRGDYILIQSDPGMTYELRATGKIKLRQYLGQQVEVSGTKSPSMSTSSDTIGFGGSPSPVTLSVKSVKMLAKECVARPVGR